MTEGESSSEDEQPETPAKDEIDQEYELPDEEGGEEDNEENTTCSFTLTLAVQSQPPPIQIFCPSISFVPYHLRSEPVPRGEPVA